MPELSKSCNQNVWSRRGPLQSAVGTQEATVMCAGMSPSISARCRCHLQSRAASPKQVFWEGLGQKGYLLHRVTGSISPGAGCGTVPGVGEGTGATAPPDHSCSIQPLDAPASHAVCRAVPVPQAGETKLRQNPRKRWSLCLTGVSDSVTSVTSIAVLSHGTRDGPEQ